MDEHQRRRVEEVMAQIASGDPAGVVALLHEFRAELLGAVRRAELHTGIRLDADEREGLASEAVFAIADVAKAWRADGGALPWTWAAARIQALVQRSAGTFADPLDDHHLEVYAATQPEAHHWSGPSEVEDAPVALLEHLSEHHATAAALRAVAEEIGDRDLELVLAYTVQQAQGDPSPACTVGRWYSLRPETVRKRVSRFRRRAQQLIAERPEYATLASLPVLTGQHEPALATVA